MTDNKNLQIAYYGNFGKKIIKTLESVLENMGAKDLSIIQNNITFRIDNLEKKIDIKEMIQEIFFLPNSETVDERLANEEEIYYKTLQVIQDTLRRLS